MRACGLDRTEIVEDLIKAGADSSARDLDGMTAIDYAKSNKAMNVLQILGQASKGDETDLGD